MKFSPPVPAWVFDEEKAAEAAVVLLKQHDGRMGRLRLVKLLYFADREAIRQTGKPIVGGDYVSMKHGPVPSQVYDCITQSLWYITEGVWEKHIKNTGTVDVELAADAPPSRLSPAEMEILVQVCRKYAGMTDAQIRDESHKLAEWKDPGQEKGARAIPERAILTALGLTGPEASARLKESQIRSREISVLRSAKP